MRTRGDAAPLERNAITSLISCLMVTRGALHPARHAIVCFQRQTYPERELVIFCDRSGAPLAAYVEALGDPRIRYVETTPAPLGALRNASVEAARGALVCQWDDDDLYAPDRLALQRAGLEQGGADGCFLRRWLIWQPARGRLAISNERLWEGSMLARRDALARYPPLATGEDTAMVVEMMRSRRLVAIDRPTLYCYVAHGANSHAEAHFDHIFSVSNPVVSGADYARVLDRLSPALPIRAYLAGL